MIKKESIERIEKEYIMRTTEEILKENYNKVLNSGMFWEFYPELTGEYEKDKRQFIIHKIDEIKYEFLAHESSTDEGVVLYEEDRIKEFLKELLELQEIWNLK